METLVTRNSIVAHAAPISPGGVTGQLPTGPRGPADTGPTGGAMSIVVAHIAASRAKLGSLWSNGWHATRHWSATHRLWLGGGIAVALGLGLDWNALAAAGVLSVLFSALPCALMMGLCMKGMRGNQRCAKGKQPVAAPQPMPQAPEVVVAPAPQLELAFTSTQENEHVQNR